MEEKTLNEEQTEEVDGGLVRYRLYCCEDCGRSYFNTKPFKCSCGSERITHIAG
ncbi:MAG: hypothetical protein LBL98_05495 [Ruminococcus sp.]|nr:hypothetical protein [Ruminococcus sp.]